MNKGKIIRAKEVFKGMKTVEQRDFTRNARLKD